MLGDVIARLAAVLTLDTVAFEKGATLAEKRFEQAQRKFQKIGSAMAGVGAKMSLAITAPLTTLAVASYKAAQESADALGQVESALKSMGDASGRTSEQLQALASKQMATSLYDDDEILRKVTANLLTFGKISGTAFDQAQQAAIDLSARLGTDLQSSAILVGKALNDPVKGVSALTRVGVSFTEQQKQQIKAMVEAGNTAGAQSLILGELQKQYSGAAAAARAADPTAAQTQAWNDFQETIGKFVIEVLPPLTAFLTRVLEGFNNLSPGMQKVVVVGGAVLAALGPVLTVFGGLVTVGAPLLSFLVGVAPAFAALAAALLPLILNPVFLGLAATVLGIYLAWKNWDKIVAIVSGLYNAVKTWIMDKLGGVFDWVSKKVKAVGDTFAWLYDVVVGHSYVPDMVDGIAKQMARLQDVMVAPAQKGAKATADAMRQMASEIGGLLDRLFPVSAALRQYREELDLINQSQKKGLIGADIANTARDALMHETIFGSNDNTIPAPDFLKDVQPLTEGMKDVSDSIEKMGQKAKITTVAVTKSFKDMADQTLQSLQGLASSIKGGGFLDILSSVLGVVTQLGSIGAFGKSFADRINAPKIPGNANGTSHWGGGLTLVGERGPELVDLPRGSRVTPNNQIGGMTSVQIVPSPYFNVVVDGRIQQAAGPIMIGGANVAQARSQRSQSRRVA